MRIKYYLCLLFTITLLSVSCKKEEGKGGNNTIKGYVVVKEYIDNFNNFVSEHDGYDENVYIIYGDDHGVGDKAVTGPDGRFEFKYLREGTYKVYIYSKDSVDPGLIIPDTTILKTIEISGKKKTIDAGTFEKKKVN